MKVELIDYMGTDLSVVNAARVSFSKESDWERDSCGGCGNSDPEKRCLGCLHPFDKRLSKADQSLIEFLARGCSSGDWDEVLCELGGSSGEQFEALVNEIRKMPTHWTPFAHTAISLRTKAPIFIARQFGKTQVGMVWNEVSRRYVDDEPEFYAPETWRKRADNVKQGSSDEEVVHKIRFRGVVEGWETSADDLYQQQCDTSLRLYSSMLDSGVCPEQARMVLPQSMMTEWIWTGNLYSFANVYTQRSNSHAQKEAQDLAEMIREVIEPLFPVSWKELTK